jgi:CBS-domain-containing membrane protein
MKNSSLNVAALIAVLVTSAVMMLWLFWRFPILTAIATSVILVGLAVSARLATSTEPEGSSDLDGQEHGIQSP